MRLGRNRELPSGLLCSTPAASGDKVGLPPLTITRLHIDIWVPHLSRSEVEGSGLLPRREVRAPCRGDNSTMATWFSPSPTSPNPEAQRTHHLSRWQHWVLRHAPRDPRQAPRSRPGGHSPAGCMRLRGQGDPDDMGGGALERGCASAPGRVRGWAAPQQGCSAPS